MLLDLRPYTNITISQKKRLQKNDEEIVFPHRLAALWTPRNSFPAVHVLLLLLCNEKGNICLLCFSSITALQNHTHHSSV
jgi:hypothetical protein